MNKKQKDKAAFNKWAKIGAVISFVLISTYYGIYPFHEAKPEAKIAASIFVLGVGVIGIVTLFFYLFTQQAVFGSRVDGFMTAAGVISLIIKGIVTGQWI